LSSKKWSDLQCCQNCIIWLWLCHCQLNCNYCITGFPYRLCDSSSNCRQMVSLWTCSKMCAIFFVAGIVVGYTLKKRVRRWAAKLLRRLKDDWRSKNPFVCHTTDRAAYVCLCLMPMTSHYILTFCKLLIDTCTSYLQATITPPPPPGCITYNTGNLCCWGLYSSNHIQVCSPRIQWHVNFLSIHCTALCAVWLAY